MIRVLIIQVMKLVYVIGIGITIGFIRVLRFWLSGFGLLGLLGRAIRVIRVIRKGY
jgi:hypothetical protein